MYRYSYNIQYFPPVTSADSHRIAYTYEMFRTLKANTNTIFFVYEIIWLLSYFQHGRIKCLQECIRYSVSRVRISVRITFFLLNVLKKNAFQNVKISRRLYKQQRSIPEAARGYYNHNIVRDHVEQQRFFCNPSPDTLYVMYFWSRWIFLLLWFYKNAHVHCAYDECILLCNFMYEIRIPKAYNILYTISSTRLTFDENITLGFCSIVHEYLNMHGFVRIW